MESKPRFDDAAGMLDAALAYDERIVAAVGIAIADESQRPAESDGDAAWSYRFESVQDREGETLRVVVLMTMDASDLGSVFLRRTADLRVADELPYWRADHGCKLSRDEVVRIGFARLVLQAMAEGEADAEKAPARVG